jgi:hypothetical protein
MRRLAVVLLVACNGSSSPGPSDSGGPTGWTAAVGGGGLVLQTFDDKTWNVRAVVQIDLYSVTCVGALDGWAVGANGTIAHTTDGGGTWSLQPSALSTTLRGVRFADAMHGVVAGDKGALGYTTDGGSTWVTVAVTSDDFTGVAATSDGTFYVASADGQLLRSSNWGASYDWLGMGSAVVCPLTAVAASSDLLVVGDTLGHLLTSTDRGESFTLESMLMAPVGAVSLAGEWGGGAGWGGSTALAVGDEGTVQLRGVDGVWVPMESGTSANLHAALLGTTSYIAGDDGTLLRLDHGAWTPVATGTHVAVNALDDL